MTQQQQQQQTQRASRASATLDVSVTSLFRRDLNSRQSWIIHMRAPKTRARPGQVPWADQSGQQTTVQLELAVDLHYSMLLFVLVLETPS